MTLAIAIIGLVATMAATVAALGSWQAAMRANETATKLADVDHDRRHEELTPEFEITCTEQPTAAGRADLAITLTGGTQWLDEVIVTILDETGQDHWGRGLPAGVTREQAAEFVWGPWQFNTGAAERVVDPRTSKARPYSRVSGNNWDRLSLCRTSPGTWMPSTSEATWRQERAGPLRLRLTCRRDSYEPWFLLREVEATSETQSQNGTPPTTE